MEDLRGIAGQFINQGEIVDISGLGNGNINQTYLVTVSNSTRKYFVLQQINSHVFPNPVQVMDNLQLVSQHILNKIKQYNLNWQIPEVILSSQAKHHFIDSNNNFWRGISFIEKADSAETIDSLEQAREIGIGLGTFHKFVRDLDVDSLADTLPGFHIAPDYFQQYQLVSTKNKITDTSEVNWCQQFISDRQQVVNVLEDAKNNKTLKLRPIHGDPKINNIMLDRQSKKAIAMVDLDTVKPGLIHYDIGDCLRSGCNGLGEETHNWQQVEFDLDLAQAILGGYLATTASFITDKDRAYIYEAIRLLAFELGLRFFTDYLNHNQYFKTTYPEQNLKRALVQFKLTENIEKKEDALKKIIG